MREGGLVAATVDAITEHAGVSRRTFFNYYASKEDAILGTTSPVVPEEALANYFDESSQTDQFTRTVLLLVAVIRSTRQPDRGIAGERRELVQEFPELRERLMQHVVAAEDLVETILAEQHVAESGTVRPKDASRALLMLAGTVLRFASALDPAATDSEHEKAINQAIALFRDTLKEIV